MATIQDVFSHIYTTEAHLGDVPIKNGQIILCVDSEKLYIDHGTSRVGTSDVVQVETQDTLPLAPLDKFYITKNTGDVYFYINDDWKKLTDTSIDLSNYSQNASINLTSTAGAVNLISNTTEAALYSGTAYVKANVGSVELQGTNLKFNNNVQNTAGGIVVVDSSTGKIPASVVPETAGSVDLSAYNGLVGITTTGASAISNGASGEYKFTLGTNSNGVILTEDGSTRSITVRSIKKIYLAGGEISITGYPFKIHSNGKLELSSSQGNIILNAQDSVDANIEMHGTGILWNGAALNTAHGLVQLDASGTVPTSLLPEIGNASWTKVTINQSSFATSDDTYGGSYYELTGICSVEVYDAGGYKVEFDVKCDFTNNKTRVYIPSGLAADTISNWTLLYLAKTIA